MPSTLGRRFKLALKVLGGGLLAAVVTGAIYEQVGEWRDSRQLPQIGRSIDIGGRRMNVFCSGNGSPTVIFDSGNGDPGYTWSDIQPEIAKLTRACWFDRAGDGWSDTGPFPRTSVAMSTDLHELLHHAEIAGPYIYVGASLGGLNARVYNGLYPADIAGAVLVDAAHEDEPRRAPRFMLARMSPPRALWHPIWIAGQAARLVGFLRFRLPRISLPADPSERTRAQIVRALRNQPKAVATQFDASTPDKYAEAEHAGGFGERPLIVLTRGKVTVPPNPTEEDRAWIAYEQVWMHEIQPKLARLSTRGRQIIVEKSGHDIHADAPDVVLAAVRDNLSEVRTQPVPPGHDTTLARSSPK